MSDDLSVPNGSSSAETWEGVPLPARQQLAAVAERTGLSPEELLGSRHVSEVGEHHSVLLQPVTYHLDPPPAFSPSSNPPAEDDAEEEADEESEESTEAEEQAEEADEVPHGTMDRILAWVDGDKDRAARALAAEQAKAEPRQSLVARLSAI